MSNDDDDDDDEEQEEEALAVQSPRLADFKTPLKMHFLRVAQKIEIHCSYL